MVKASERRPVRSAMSTFRRRPSSPKMSFKVAETLFDLHAFPIQAPHRLDRWKRLTVGGPATTKIPGIAHPDRTAHSQARAPRLKIKEFPKEACNVVTGRELNTPRILAKEIGRASCRERV